MTTRKSSLRPLAALLACVSALHVLPAAATCRVDSGTTRHALVELYTSEGCSSCPPADRQLRKLTTMGSQVVPLALHVDYWDSIGWVDRFAQPAFSKRQQWEVHANGSRTSFTPHFFVNGREVLDWRADLDASLRLTSGSLPTARITIEAQPQGLDSLKLKVDGTVSSDGRPRGPLQLFVVVTESGLASQVDAGENRGVRLEHDAVARNWIGPIAIQGDNATIERVLRVPQLVSGHVGVVAFIQDSNTAEVLQAADTGICRAG